MDVLIIIVGDFQWWYFEYLWLRAEEADIHIACLAEKNDSAGHAVEIGPGQCDGHKRQLGGPNQFAIYRASDTAALVDKQRLHCRGYRDYQSGIWFC